MVVKNIKKSEVVPHDILVVREKVYDLCFFEFTNFSLEKESKEYAACNFKINNAYIISRRAKSTPKKTGQFVTVWKRIGNGPIQPINCLDTVDFFVINTLDKQNFGQFVFPKSVLLEQGIMSSDHKEGKRGIRVYPPWCLVNSKQAEKTQKWQLKYFLSININKPIDIDRAKLLYFKNE